MDGIAWPPLPRQVSRAFGIDRGLPFPLEDIPGAAVVLDAGGESGGDDATAHAVLRRAAVAWREADRRGPAPHGDGRGRPGCTCRSRRAPMGRSATACCTSRSVRSGSTRRSSRAHQRLRSGAPHVAAYWPERVERITGVPQKQIVRSGAHARDGEVGDGVHGARRRAAIARRGQRALPHEPRRSRSACRESPAPATAASRGKATARAGASTARKRTSFRAIASWQARSTAHTSRQSGASRRTTCRRLGPRRWSCSTVSGSAEACAACGCSAQTPW